MNRAITFTVHEREYGALRAAADRLYGGSVAELVRDALRHGGFSIQCRAAVPRPRNAAPPVFCAAADRGRKEAAR